MAEIDDDIEINQNNITIEYEDHELELEDIDWDDNSDILEDLQKEIQLTFVNESSVIVFGDQTEVVEKQNQQERKLVCPTCNKGHKKETYFKKHIDKCGKHC